MYEQLGRAILGAVIIFLGAVLGGKK